MLVNRNACANLGVEWVGSEKAHVPKEGVFFYLEPFLLAELLVVVNNLKGGHYRFY